MMSIDLTLRYPHTAIYYHIDIYPALKLRFALQRTPVVGAQSLRTTTRTPPTRIAYPSDMMVVLQDDSLQQAIFNVGGCRQLKRWHVMRP